MTASTILHYDHHHLLAKYFTLAVNQMYPPQYFFFGKSSEWEDELNPPLVNRLEETSEYDLRNNMLYVERLRGSEITFAIKRVDWSGGRVFDRFDYYSPTNLAFSGADNIFDSTSLVITTDMNIYKCIDNNASGVSSVMPTGKETTYFTTSDGYVWKYMYTLNQIHELNFLTDKWVPIRSSIPATVSYDGNVYKVENSGFGYNEDNTILSVSGDGFDAHIRPVITAGRITAIEVLNPGFAYTVATIDIICPDITRPRGTGAVITADFPFINITNESSSVQLTAINGELSAISVTNGGANYVVGETAVVITGDGSGASATATVENGAIKSVNIVSRGKGYSKAEVVIIGNGDGATARAIIAPSGGHGHDIVEESRSRVVAIRKAVSQTITQGIPGWTDYRQSGIIAHPDEFKNAEGDYNIYRKYFQQESGATTYGVYSPDINIDQYQMDEILMRLSDQSLWRAIAIKDEELALFSEENKVPAVGDQFTNVTVTTDATTGEPIYTPNALLFTVSFVREPEVQKFSGTLLYYDNREVYHQIKNSAVIVQTYIEF